MKHTVCKRRHIALATVIAIPLIWIAWQFLPPPAPPSLPSNRHANKAAWLGITWSMDVHNDKEIEALARNLQTYDINYAFVYISYLKPDSSFNPTYNHAARFVERLHTLAPEVTILGWVGVPVQITSPDGQYIANRLTDPSVREIIANFSARIVNEFGFDGVHVDAETVVNDDASFISTLQAIRAALPPDTVLSIAAPALRLTEPITIVPYPTLAQHWSADYLQHVAAYSDQIAFMTYDSGLFFPTDYRAWMAHQVRNISAALNHTQTHALIGIPTSEEETLTHHVTTETAENALYGVYVGLAQSDTPNTIHGIAVYPYWETDADEWAQLDSFP